MQTSDLLRASLIAASLLSAPATHAGQDEGFYGHVAFGRASIDESLDADGVPFSLDDSATAWRAAVGYAINPYFSIEAGYNDFGSVDVGVLDTTVGASADGLELGLAFRWPVSDRFAFSVRAGYLWWDAVTRIGPVSATDEGNETYAGVGAQFQAGERTAVTAGWTRYRLDDLDLDHLAMGLRWQFGASD